MHEATQKNVSNCFYPLIHLIFLYFFGFFKPTTHDPRTLATPNQVLVYIKHSKTLESVFHQVSKHVEKGQKTRLRFMFSSHLSVFEYPHETLYLVFDI